MGDGDAARGRQPHTDAGAKQGALARVPGEQPPAAAAAPDFRTVCLGEILSCIERGAVEDRASAMKLGAKLFGAEPAFVQAVLTAAVAGLNCSRGVSDSYAPVRWQALEVLAGLTRADELAAEVIVAYCLNLKYPEAYYRKRIVERLGNQKKKALAAWPYLLAQLADQDLEVRGAVAQVLGELGFEATKTATALVQSACMSLAALEGALCVDPAKAHLMGLGARLDKYLVVVCRALAQLKDTSNEVFALLARLGRYDCKMVRDQAIASMEDQGWTACAAALKAAGVAHAAIPGERADAAE